MSVSHSGTASTTPTVRLLPIEEYPRLLDVDGPLRGIQSIPDPDHTRIVVVEDQDTGRIIGYWVLGDVVHAEPLWLDPMIRSNPVVGRQLLEQVLGTLYLYGAQSVFVVIEDTNTVVREMADQLGFEPLPGRLYALRLPVVEPVKE
jgi:hypothetical protein